MAAAPAGAAVPVLAVPLDLWGALLLRWDTGRGGPCLPFPHSPRLLLPAELACLLLRCWQWQQGSAPGSALQMFLQERFFNK